MHLSKTFFLCQHTTWCHWLHRCKGAQVTTKDNVTKSVLKFEPSSFTYDITFVICYHFNAYKYYCCPHTHKSNNINCFKMVPHFQTKISTHLQTTIIQTQKKHKQSPHNNVHKQNLHKNIANLQQHTLCVMEFLITKSDLKKYNLRLYPKHKISQTQFTLKLVPK
jgi:hypothetical protein